MSSAPALDGIRTQRTYCRICESACGLIATLRGDRLEGLAPDPDHPVSSGYACAKGTRFAAVHHHEARVLAPRLGRREPREASWGEALASVGGRLSALIDQHGPGAVGIYSGNAAGHSLGAVLGVTALQRGLGTPRHYACLTLDNAPMFVVLEEVLGDALRTATADYDGSDCIVLFGTDPLSSQPSQAQSHPDGVRQLARAAADGRLVVVDPRRSDTARRAHHLAPQVGTDVDLLAHLLAVVLAAPPRDDWLDRDDLDALRCAVEPFTAERAAAATGLEQQEIEGLAKRLLDAERPLVWSGLGVLLGPEGTVGWWLTLALQAALGGLDRPGGWRFHPGAVDLPALGKRLGLRARDPSLRGRSGHPAILGTLPAADLTADILEGGLRALVVVGGNPLAALPDTAAAGRALDALELLVCVDLFVNATGARADAVLPACSWAAREDVAIQTAPQRPVPHLQLARPLVKARGSARPDWDILLDLCRAAGRPPFGSRLADLALRGTGLGPTGIARAAVAAYGRVRWRDVRSPGGAVAPRPDGGLRSGPPPTLAVAEFIAALGSRPEVGGGLRLLTSVRPPGAMNSWMQGSRASERSAPTARVHPADLADRGLAGSSTGTLRAVDGTGQVTVALLSDPTLGRGTVVLPYGSVDGSPNHLVGAGALEAFTGQPRSNGVCVEIGPVGPTQ